ncbi:hypothetical protein EA187_15340 [Lujinxingia sediminis]|uniref:SH3 domain-containing protein n=1 Tax=Lujinxingia sediminis TaxID=2480984 RepID=A0ABY0CQ19_9DELT|nr:hypothetical protein [Lujinxingia sediminis]RVU42563.1 hypothetical protein EA187_15340 [Lujinxingia sediminis]
MKMLLKLFLTAMVLTAGGCGDFVENLCRYDADCQSAQYCIDLQCVNACADDDECSEGRRCLSYQRSGEVEPVDACLIDDRLPSDVQCSSDEQCREELNSTRVFCGLDGRCAYRVEESDTDGEDAGISADASVDEDASTLEDADANPAILLLIEQNQPEPNADGDTGADTGIDADAGLDAGTDPIAVEVAPVRIGAVIARSPEGSAEAYGRIVRVETPQMPAVEAYLQPAPVALDESEMCIKEAARARFTSLGGPGGWMLVEFVDGYGDRILPRSDWSVEIFAESPLCPLGHELEQPSSLPAGSYRAALCSGEPGQLSVERDCGAPEVEAQQGFTEFVVTL